MAVKKQPFGLTLPVERGSNGYFNQSFDLKKQVKTNLINLILTKPGERIMQPLFGCKIHRLVFENITDDAVVNARGFIEEAIQMWMPFIFISNINVVREEDKNKIYVVIDYNLKSNVKITDQVTVVL